MLKNYDIPAGDNIQKHQTVFHHQRGATLIVVLLILILIMLVGTMAVRRSSTNLKVATSDQISTLLLQGADGANIKLQGIVNGPTTSQAYQDALIEKNGIFSHFFNDPQNLSDEVVYCYNPRSLQTITNKATIFHGTGTIFDNGRCDATKADNYISGRQTTMTQVSITTAPIAANGKGFSNTVLGRDINNTTEYGSANPTGVTPFNIRSVSAIPAYNDVGSCYDNTHKGLDSTKNILNVTSCLRNAGVPSKELYQRLDLAYETKSINCVKLGVGSGMSSACTAIFE